MNKKMALGFILGTILCIGVILFIIYSNDHSECAVAAERKTDTNGNIVTITKHVCREKFSF